MAGTDQPAVRAHHNSTIVSPRLAWSVTAANEFATIDPGPLPLPVGNNALGRSQIVCVAVTLVDQNASDLMYWTMTVLIDDLAGISCHGSGQSLAVANYNQLAVFG